MSLRIAKEVKYLQSGRLASGVKTEERLIDPAELSRTLQILEADCFQRDKQGDDVRLFYRVTVRSRKARK